MNLSLKYKVLRSRLCTVTALSAVALFLLQLLLTKLEIALSSDILRQDGFLATLLPFVQVSLTTLSFALFYSLTIFLWQKLGFTATLPMMLSVIGLTLFRSLLSLADQYFWEGVSSYDFFLLVLPTQALSFVLELTQYLLILLIAWLCLGRAPADAVILLPLVKREIPKPLLFPYFLSALAILLFNMGSRLFSFGIPISLQDFLYLALAFFFDILIYGALLFVAMLLLAAWAQRLCQKLSYFEKS